MNILGLYRFFLATAVVCAHLLNGYFPDSGRNAVVAFFGVSGFLITKICNEIYRNRKLSYLTNRLLRIYPTYWVCIILVVSVKMAFPSLGESLNGWMGWPTTTNSWINQIILVNLLSPEGARSALIPQSWSLELEIIFYIVIGLFTSRSFYLTLGIFLLTFAIGLLSFFEIIPIRLYSTLLGSAFMFYAGSLSYFLSKRVNLTSRVTFAGLIILVFCTLVLPLTVEHHQDPQNLYKLNAILFLSCFGSLIFLTGLPHLYFENKFIKRVSFNLGRLSYPLFLLHTCIANIFSKLMGQDKIILFFSTYIVTIFFSYLIVRLIENPLESARILVRNNNSVLQN